MCWGRTYRCYQSPNIVLYGIVVNLLEQSMFLMRTDLEKFSRDIILYQQHKGRQHSKRFALFSFIYTLAAKYKGARVNCVDFAVK